ncbi:carcinine hydrolase/isopenicillin-N N-acyltransferase family protein [Flavivirga spongiicola]|uniref:Carcinine hydrolase/isopenicillin-N N-acyltransferase family protein n=1 Tax=Flavivirga spongiicola TaxID=421621 RepID=A0ABU7XSI0_9FLAO|nr:carcinine hydrolase/isopenicillin-N N-acyltransferase family protein [Flavivirga sp. MEBiC05379]MDO5978688.1 carcinine hydrolase/isopenicillin-N N-acyltransferase family protein [Flavivirga sp. MEBiC05379]
MKKIKYLILIVMLLSFCGKAFACSIIYYVDKKNGKIYFVNNEDYFYDVKPYIQIKPSSKGKLGRIWYGWKDFGQGGINEKGLVIDGAVTPEQIIPNGYSSPKGNITDELLAQCQTVYEAVQYLEDKKVALKNAHILLGDKNGKAVIVEWVNGVKNIVEIKDNRLVATNFNLSDTEQTNMTCWRYPIIQNGLNDLDAREIKDTVTLKDVGKVMAKVVQTPQADVTGKVGGTLYTTFIDVTEMKLVLVYKLDNSKVHKLDILKELKRGKSKKIKLK